MENDYIFGGIFMKLFKKKGSDLTVGESIVLSMIVSVLYAALVMGPMLINEHKEELTTMFRKIFKR